MTRFTGNSFKATPIRLEGRTDERNKVDFITDKITERMFNSTPIPNAGWISFQEVRGRGSLDLKSKISPVKLPNGLTVLPATAVVDRIDTKLKNKLKPNNYLELPEEDKYTTIPVDFIFFNYKEKGEDSKEKLYCLLSATSERTVELSEKEFLRNIPFTSYGYIPGSNPIQFSIPSDLILWLLYHAYEKDGKISSNIAISDVSLIDGKLPVPVSLKYQGKSTPEYLSEVKYSIAQRRTFYKVECTIRRNDTEVFQFSLDTHGCVEFKPSLCEFVEKEERMWLRNFAKVTTIYTEIIPTIKALYQSDVSWESTTREEFIQKCAKDCAGQLKSSITTEQLLLQG